MSVLSIADVLRMKTRPSSILMIAAGQAAKQSVITGKEVLMRARGANIGPARIHDPWDVTTVANKYR